MKPFTLALVSSLLLAAGTLNSNAWLKYGIVYCDANTNGLIDSADLRVQSALVVVTNTSGTFSNASWTTIDGQFLMLLRDVPDTYVDFVLSATLPDGTTAVLPAANTFAVTNDVTITNNFLIENPACAIAPPTPFKIGHVYCDANTNRMIDSGDAPVPDVLVVVTNFSGTFSNGAFTDAKGFFSIALPQLADLYGDYIVTSSLPAGSTLAIPGENQVFQFSIPTPYPSQIVTNDYLIENPACVAPPTPYKIGHVYCDANTNRMIDSGDAAVPDVLVVVTNFSGTFSNGAFTDAKGFFSIALPQITDLYGDYIVTSSLPAGSTLAIPGENQVFQFSIPTPYPSQIVTNDYLIQNAACITIPPSNSGHCWLTGAGTIKAGKGKPLHSFGGVVNPGCISKAPGGGTWNDIDFGQSLHFRGRSLQVVDCGNVTESTVSKSPKSPFSFIEFQGAGTLKGIAKNKADYGTVQFFAHAEDLNEPGRKTYRLYLRVFDSVENTLLLISANPANPLDIAPVTISTGTLQIHPCR